MKEDNKVSSFCKATSASKDEAFYFLEGFDWNLKEAIFGFLNDQLPPLKQRLPPLPSSQPPHRVNELRNRSRSPLRPRYSTTTTTSVSEPKCTKMEKDELNVTNTTALGPSLVEDDDSRELLGS